MADGRSPGLQQHVHNRRRPRWRPLAPGLFPGHLFDAQRAAIARPMRHLRDGLRRLAATRLWPGPEPSRESWHQLRSSCITTLRPMLPVPPMTRIRFMVAETTRSYSVVSGSPRRRRFFGVIACGIVDVQTR
jgi:hypothetical protein